MSAPASSVSGHMPTLPESGTVALPKWVVVGIFTAALSIGGGGFAAAWTFTVQAAKTETTLQEVKANQRRMADKLEKQTSDRFTEQDGRELKQELLLAIAVLRGSLREHRIHGHPKVVATLESAMSRIERLERRLDEGK